MPTACGDGERPESAEVAETLTLGSKRVHEICTEEWRKWPAAGTEGRWMGAGRRAHAEDGQR
jgi:hypothetical protein